ncbi:MAG: hypothetical protein SFX73_32165 [Kofleriaceae bacterium]|nr:hypothetical protein [Kofleriaceae bacterium]
MKAAAMTLVGLLACGGDPAEDPGGGSAPPPGTSADGWQSQFSADSARAACSGDEAAFASLPHVTVGSTTIYVGYTQASANNQDPVVARFDDGVQIWCQHHETQGPDGRAHAITWDGGDRAYVVYSVVGGGTDLEGKGGWFPSYAANGISGGGPKVSYVGMVDTSDGALVHGTFVISVKSDRKVNSHMPRAAATVLQDGGVEFLGASAHKPLDVDGRNAMTCTDYPFDSRYRFDPDLRAVRCADCTNCQSTMPCE